VLGPILAALDLAVVYLLLHAGKSLQFSQLAGFAVSATLYFFWFATGLSRSRSALSTRRPYLQALTRVLAALLLRAAVLALLVSRCQWAPQFAILLAVPVGLTVLLGYRALTPSWQTFAAALTIYSCALRLLYAGSVDLMPEETYYWNYAQHLDYGYLDHPPMVAWLIQAGTTVLGQTEFAVRAGALLCGSLTSFFVYRLARNVFGIEAAFASLALTQALPFFFLSGMLLTPDSPLTACWAACLYFLERALVAEKAGAWWGAGIALGLGLISKYTILLVAISACIYVLWEPRSRHWLRRYEPYAAALCALCIFSPVLIWNIEHHWASFAFQTSGRLAEAPRFALPNLLGSVILLLSPVGALSLALDFGGRDVQPGGGRRFLQFATLLPLAVFVLFSLHHQVKLDWTGAPWIAALPILGAAMTWNRSKPGAWRGWLRAAWQPTLALLILFYAAGLYYLVLGWPGVGYTAHIELLPVGWQDLGRQVLAVAEESQHESAEFPVIVGMDRYAIASELAYQGERELKTPVLTSSANLFGGVGLMYEYWTPPVSLAHRTLLLVAFDPNDLKGRYVEPRAAQFGPIQTISLKRDGKPVRDMYYRFAYDYRP
jgi:dolichol-phosphate mannosyltransferase